MAEIPGSKPTSLEDEFFRKQDQKLIDRQRELRQLERTRESLARVSGIQDPTVLQRFVDLRIGPETLAALAMIPLIEVAWADGDVDAKEREAILAAARAEQTPEGGLDLTLLEEWLRERPPASMLEAWKVYVQGLLQGLPGDEAARLQSSLLDRARSVAEASGGLLGLGKKVSAKEEAVLRKLEQAFAP